MTILDGYNLFFREFGIVDTEEIIHFGIKNVIKPKVETAEVQWLEQLTLLLNNGQLPIRGYGRDALGTSLYFQLYKDLFNNNNIIKDATNNNFPTRNLEEWTGFFKNPSRAKLDKGANIIRNFQVSHVFGNTKNPLMFTAPWNIIFLPKIMDPFTGHESKGNLSVRFSISLRKYIFEEYSHVIEDYNTFVKENVQNEIAKVLKHIVKNNQNFTKIDQFYRSAIQEWSYIRL